MSKRILIVDDEAKMTKLLAEFFIQQGFEADTASNGLEAIEKLKQTIPDLIVLDVMMPGMDGYTFIREMKKTPAWRVVPVIVVTAREMMRDLFVEEGVREYMIKPFEPAELVAAVQKILSK